jgi:2-keto-4-pentenoate hydratase
MKKISEIAKLFADSRHKASSIIKPSVIGTIEDAYALQREVINLGIHNPLGKCAGWKIGATSVAIQSKLGFGPFFGPLFANTILPSGKSVSLKSLGPHFKATEVEFAFKIGSDLPPLSKGNYLWKDVLSNVAYLYPSIELAAARIAPSTPESIVADFASNGCNILGSPLALSVDPDEILANLANSQVSLSVNGTAVVQGIGSNVMGNPLFALTWLANALNERGYMLRKDDIVLTGAAAVHGSIPIDGDLLNAEFRGLHGYIRNESVLVNIIK